MKSKVVQPLLGNFVKQDLYCRKSWRRIQFLANDFWSRWRREWLPQLQERRKWNVPQDSFEPGDVVLLMDDNTPRCQWPRAVVTEVYPGQDGHVRKVKLRTATTCLERPIHKLVMLFKPGIPDGEAGIDSCVVFSVLALQSAIFAVCYF